MWNVFSTLCNIMGTKCEHVHAVVAPKEAPSRREGGKLH